MKRHLSGKLFNRQSFDSFQTNQCLGELAELRSQLESATAGRAAAEERIIQLMKDRNGIQSQLDDIEEEYQELLKKYKAQVQQVKLFIF